MPIPQIFDEAFARVKELVNTFKENEAFYTGSAYQEAEARKDFIDKFWIALGWDINSEEETDPYKQRAKVERAVATSEFRKRADYAFYSSNFRDVQFFVEAKKPRVGLDNSLFYFQTIRYGWNSHVPISVLHDFEEMRVLDCRYKPDINTALGHAVLKYHFTDYANEQSFRTIYYLFSRQKVDDGSIQEYAKGLPKISRKRAARGVATDEHQSIDESFLQELDVFREELARGYKRKNPELDSAALTEVTQRTLDRLVFMRFLEDKLIESDQLIEDLHRKGNSWENFIATSRRLDRVYNGIIFKEHGLLDSGKFKADERVFDKISKSLSHRESPYDFNAIPIHILGSIYERFLGKVIVATAKQARVEDKPEVRKAGGVYYTPEYIVRYIVENTVGKLIEGKTPAQIQEMRFADIACGSGSFLLGVYDTLLRYHTAYYNRTKKIREAALKARSCIPKEDGTIQLSLLQKRQILLNNIYGVDIDPQAVEVAQLSLYLKLLEDETIASTRQQQLALREALLPSLSKNIVCGNSLIGWDILEGKLFDSGEERKLNPMNFEDAFPEVMKRGGFDAIVGNPPYIRPHKMDSVTKEYFWKTLKTFVAKSDIYSCFMEKGLNLLRETGHLGFIVPITWTSLESFEAIRRKLVQETEVLLLAQLPKKVFQDATVETCLFAAQKSAHPNPNHKIRVVRLDGSSKAAPVRTFTQSEITKGHLHNFQLYAKSGTSAFADRLKSISEPLSALVEFVYGFKTADDEKFIQSGALYNESKPFIRSAAINRYTHDAPHEYVWYVPQKMKAHRKTARPGEAERFEAEKIMVARMGKELIASYDSGGLYVKDAMLLLQRDASKHSLKYLLALLNSRLLGYLYREFFVTIDVLKNAILNLPIRPIDFSNLSDKAGHDRIVQLVDQMLEAKKQLASAQTERDKSFYDGKCATLDRQIDNLVYELYELTPEEIAIVEEAGP
jgi:type I restriction-modification system DNA methylase subunit